MTASLFLVWLRQKCSQYREQWQCCSPGNSVRENNHNAPLIIVTYIYCTRSQGILEVSVYTQVTGHTASCEKHCRSGSTPQVTGQTTGYEKYCMLRGPLQVTGNLHVTGVYCRSRDTLHVRENMKVAGHLQVTENTAGHESKQSSMIKTHSKDVGGEECQKCPLHHLIARSGTRPVQQNSTLLGRQRH